MSTNKTYLHFENVCKEKELDGLATIGLLGSSELEIVLRSQDCYKSLEEHIFDDELEENSVSSILEHTAWELKEQIMATNKITESEIEQFAIELLEKSGYQYIYAPYIATNKDTQTRKIQ